jgi:N-acyl-D-amino-acid deacylase
MPVHLTHFRQGFQRDGSHPDYLALVEDARDGGMDVTFDCYTYPYSGTTITIGFPFWAKDGGPERLIEALQDADDRARMKIEMSEESIKDNWLTNFNQPKNKIYEGKSIAEISDLRDQDSRDALFDLLLEENLGISTVGLGTNPQALPDFVSHHWLSFQLDEIQNQVGFADWFQVLPSIFPGFLQAINQKEHPWNPDLLDLIFPLLICLHIFCFLVD